MLDKVKQVLENKNTRENITAMGPEAAMRLDETIEMLDDMQDGTSQNFADFMNNHPNLTGLIIWLVMVLNTIGSLGPIVGKQHKEADMDQIAKQIMREIQEETDSMDNGQPEPENKNKVPAMGGGNPYPNAMDVYTIDPKDEKLLNERGSYVLQLLPNFETYKRLNKDGTFGRNSGESRCTFGYGDTWEDIRVGNVVYRYPCSNKYLPETASLVKEIKDNYKKDNRQYFIERAKLHMLVETLPTLRRALKDNNMPAPEDLPDHQLAALLLSGYQMQKDIISNVQRLAKAKTDEAKINAFAWTWASKGNLTGTFARKYWLGLLYTHKITMEDLLKFPIDKFNKINRPTAKKGVWDTSSYIVGNSRQDIKRGNSTIHGCKFKITKQDIEENKRIVKLSTATETLAQHLDKHGLKKVNKEKQSKKSVLTSVVDKIKEKFTNTPDVNSVMKSAKNAYDKGNYTEAAKLYNSVIEADKDNIEAYSSLVLVYKNLGDNTSGAKAIQYYEKACDIAKQGLERIKQNKKLASFTTKASIYYNAGLAREGIAEHHRQQKNNSEAKQQYDMAKINHNNAYKSVKGKDNNKAKTYKDAVNRVEQNLHRLKTNAFDFGSDKINNLMMHDKQNDKLNLFKKVNKRTH